MVSVLEREVPVGYSHIVDEEVVSDDENLDIETWLSIDVSLWIFRIVVIGLLVFLIRATLSIDNKLETINVPTSYSYGRYSEAQENPYVGKIVNWGQNTPVGRQMATLVMIPQYCCKLLFNIILLPGRFVVMKIGYVSYLICVLCLIVLLLYWVMYTFLANTLGSWAVAVLPHPASLARETVFHVGSIAVSMWTNFTDNIRERVYNLYGHMNQGVVIGTPTRGGSIVRRKTIRTSVPYPVKFKRDLNPPRAPSKINLENKNTRFKMADVSPQKDEFRRMRQMDADENRVNREFKSKFKIGPRNWNSGTAMPDEVGGVNKKIGRKDVPVEVLAPSRGLKGGLRQWY